MVLLKAVRVVGFRSIRDSGWVNISPLTGIVGENESGKTSFLLAISNLSLDLKFSDDDRNAHEDDLLPFIEAEFLLSHDELKVLQGATLKRLNSRTLYLTKDHENRYSARVGDIPLFKPASTRVFKKLSVPEKATDWTESLEIADKEADAQLSLRITQRISEIEEEAVRTIALQASERLSTRFSSPSMQLAQVLKLLGVLQEYSILTAEEVDTFKDLYSKNLQQITPKQLTIEQCVANMLPSITYLDKYDVIKAHYTEAELTKAGKNSTIRRLLQLANLKIPDAFRAQGAERAKIEARAKSTVLGILSKDWQQKQVQLVFRLDEHEGNKNLHILVESDNGVPIELNRRSDGFQWFLSFYAAFNHANSDLRNCIFLLDDPAVSLHARGQSDAYRTFERLAEQNNTIIFTTHSPFLVDQRNLHRYKLAVNLESEKKGTLLTHPLPDNGTPPIQPLLSAMGVPIGSSFLRKDILLVPEGPIDYFLWQALLSFAKSEDVNRIGLVPARNAGNVQLLCSLCAALEIPYLGVVDGDDQGQNLLKKMSDEGSKRILNIRRLDELIKCGTAENFFSFSDYARAAEIAHELNTGDIQLSQIDQEGKTDNKRLLQDYFSKRLKIKFSGLKTAETIARLCDPLEANSGLQITPIVDANELVTAILLSVKT